MDCQGDRAGEENPHLGKKIVDFLEVAHGLREEVDFIQQESTVAVSLGKSLDDPEEVAAMRKCVDGKIECVLIQRGNLLEENGLPCSPWSHDPDQMPALSGAKLLEH